MPMRLIGQNWRVVNQKATPQDGLAKDFANKGAVLTQILVVLINLAEEVTAIIESHTISDSLKNPFNTWVVSLY
jgi:hypothetical protein